MIDAGSRTVEGRFSNAFWLQYNVILLAGAVLYSAALASFTPLAYGALAEAVWLVLATTVPSLYLWVERQRAAMRGDGSAPLDTVAGELDGSYAARYRGVVRIREKIWRADLDMTGVTVAELKTTKEQLALVERSFVRLALVHGRLSKFLQSVRTNDMEQDAARVSQAFVAEKDLSVRLALRQQLTLLQRRLHQREQTVNAERAIELQMVAIEQSFLYLESQVLGLGSARELKAEVDAFMVQVGSVDALEAEAGNALAPVGTMSLTSRPVSITYGS